MTLPEDAALQNARRAVVEAPADLRAYEAVIAAAEARDLGSAVQAARRGSLLAPADRRARQNLLILLRRADLWDEIYDAVPRRARPLPPRLRHPVDADAALARHDWLIGQMRQRLDEGWTPSHVEQWKAVSSLDRRHLLNFRRSGVSTGTQTVPDHPAGFPSVDMNRLFPDVTESERQIYTPVLYRQYLGLLQRLYRAAVPGIDWYDAAAQDDDRFAARTFDVPRLGTVTSKSLQSAYYACRIMSLVPRNGVVLEIGGGFGALAARLLAIRPDVTCVLTDLPINMVLTHAYLTSLHGDAVAGLWEDGDRPEPGHRALVVPPWRLASLPLRVDLAVNTMSFQHMDERNHAFYGNAMRTLGTRRLYHVNRNQHVQGWDTMVVPAEQYGFMADYHVAEQRDFDGKWIEVIADARN